MTTTTELKRYYELGKAKCGMNARRYADWAFDENNDPESVIPQTHDEWVFLECGLRGLEFPQKVRGFRFGHIPNGGQSFNYRDDCQESGVSMAWIEGIDDEETLLGTQLFYGGRPKVWVEGYLHPYRKGSDGEPLIICAREIPGPNE
mgnify:CR=1 FL=1